MLLESMTSFSFIDWTLNILQLNNKPLFPGFDSADKKYVHCAKPSTYSGGVIATM